MQLLLESLVGRQAEIVDCVGPRRAVHHRSGSLRPGHRVRRHRLGRHRRAHPWRRGRLPGQKVRPHDRRLARGRAGHRALASVQPGDLICVSVSAELRASSGELSSGHRRFIWYHDVWLLGKVDEVLSVGDDPDRGVLASTAGCDLDRAVVHPDGDLGAVHLDVEGLVQSDRRIRVERGFEAEQ
jgi:hypothetical protein